MEFVKTRSLPISILSGAVVGLKIVGLVALFSLAIMGIAALGYTAGGMWDLYQQDIITTSWRIT